MDDHDSRPAADVVRIEVADRLEAIGRLGAHVRYAEMPLDEAIRIAGDLLGRARTWCPR